MSEKTTYIITQYAFSKLVSGQEIQILPNVSIKVSEELQATKVVPMILWCPSCHMRHVDKGEFATKPHHTHACQNCGMVWRPAIVHTVGVTFLPGFKDAP